MKTSVLPLLALVALVTAAAHAGPRTSANYSIITDTNDGGGARSTSATYTNDGSAGAITGLATVSSPEVVARNGYAGQLYDVTALVLNSASVTNSVNETATLQLAGFQQLDDASFIAIDASTINWSVVSGPITGVSVAGLATAGAVYQDTPATVQGVFNGFTGQLNLTVLDSIPDNFGTYAGDGLPDDWQVQYFGQDNPLAAPTADADGTGQNNLFKFTAGLNPTDGSRFTITIAPVDGQPGQKNIIFNPVVAGRTYTVTARIDLSVGSWGSINASAPSDNGNQRTITDLSAGGTAKFYHVEVAKP
jgi:hypothetical protein